MASQQPANGILCPHHVLCAASQQSGNGTLCPHTMFSVLLHSSQQMGHSLYTPCSLCCFTAVRKQDTLSTHHVLCAASQQSGNGTFSLHTFSVLFHSSQEPGHSLYIPCSLCCFPAASKWDTLSTHHVLCAACLLYTSPSPRDLFISRMPSSA